jgi:hypothetical protein
MLLSVGVFNSAKYHLVWAKKPETANSFEKNLMDMTAFIKTLPMEQEKFVIAENMQRIPIQLFTHNLPRIKFVYYSQAENISPANSNFIIILTHHDQNVFEKLQKKFPEKNLEEKNDGRGTRFFVLN